MLNSVSTKNIYLKPQMGRNKQNLPQNTSAAQIPPQNNFVYPSAENFKAIAFGANKNTFIIYNDQKLAADGKITENKSIAYSEIFEKQVKKHLNDNEQETFKQFFIERNDSIDDKYFIGLKRLSDKLHQTMMGLSPEDKIEKPVIKHLKSEINYNENYKKIKSGCPLIYKDKLYFPDGQRTEEKRKLYEEILPEIKNGFSEENANLFKRFFIDSEKLSFEKLYKLQYINAKDQNNLRNQDIQNYLSREIVLTEHYKNEKIKDEEKQLKLEDAYEKHDYGKVYELNKPTNFDEEEEFCEDISRRAENTLGVSINLPTKTFGAKFHIALIEQLQLLKELNQPMPNTIGSYRKPVEWNENHTGYSTTSAAHYEINTASGFSTIEFNAESIEASRELNNPEEKTISDFIDHLNHEMTHIAQYVKEPEKYDQGFEAWIDGDKRKTYKDFANLYEANYDKIKWSDDEKNKPYKDMFDLNVPYNMKKFVSNWRTVYHTLTNDANQNTDIKNIFPSAKIEEMDDIALNLYKKSDKLFGLGGYAWYNGREAVAEGGKIEMSGKPVSKDNLVPLKPETREVLKELGKPDCPTFTYLPDDYFKPKEKLN
jgi:hypothetical protein